MGEQCGVCAVKRFMARGNSSTPLINGRAANRKIEKERKNHKVNRYMMERR